MEFWLLVTTTESNAWTTRVINGKDCSRSVVVTQVPFHSYQQYCGMSHRGRVSLFVGWYLTSSGGQWRCKQLEVLHISQWEIYQVHVQVQYEFRKAPLQWQCPGAPYKNHRSKSTLFCHLWSPYGIGQTIYIFMLWFILSSFFSSPNLSRRRLDVCHTSTHGVVLVQI